MTESTEEAPSEDVKKPVRRLSNVELPLFAAGFSAAVVGPSAVALIVGFLTGSWWAVPLVLALEAAILAVIFACVHRWGLQHESLKLIGGLAGLGAVVSVPVILVTLVVAAAASV